MASCCFDGLPIFESTLIASHRYPRFHAYRFNSSIGLPMPPAKPWQNVTKARYRRLSDLRTVLLSARFTFQILAVSTFSSRISTLEPAVPNSLSQLLLNGHTDAPRATSETLEVGPPSHRNPRLSRMNSGRLAVQAVSRSLVARIVIADQANSSGFELSLYSHSFVTVRRSLGTRFAIGQRPILAFFAVRHFSSPHETLKCGNQLAL